MIFLFIEDKTKLDICIHKKITRDIFIYKIYFFILDKINEDSSTLDQIIFYFI